MKSRKRPRLLKLREDNVPKWATNTEPLQQEVDNRTMEIDRTSMAVELPPLDTSAFESVLIKKRGATIDLSMDHEYIAHQTPPYHDNICHEKRTNSIFDLTLLNDHRTINGDQLTSAHRTQDSKRPHQGRGQRTSPSLHLSAVLKKQRSPIEYKNDHVNQQKFALQKNAEKRKKSVIAMMAEEKKGVPILKQTTISSMETSSSSFSLKRNEEIESIGNNIQEINTRENNDMVLQNDQYQEDNTSVETDELIHRLNMLWDHNNEILIWDAEGDSSCFFSDLPPYEELPNLLIQLNEDASTVWPILQQFSAQDLTERSDFIAFWTAFQCICTTESSEEDFLIALEWCSKCLLHMDPDQYATAFQQWMQGMLTMASSERRFYGMRLTHLMACIWIQTMGVVAGREEWKNLWSLLLSLSCHENLWSCWHVIDTQMEWFRLWYLKMPYQDNKMEMVLQWNIVLIVSNRMKKDIHILQNWIVLGELWSCPVGRTTCYSVNEEDDFFHNIIQTLMNDETPNDIIQYLQSILKNYCTTGVHAQRCFLLMEELSVHVLCGNCLPILITMVSLGPCPEKSTFVQPIMHCLASLNFNGMTEALVSDIARLAGCILSVPHHYLYVSDSSVRACLQHLFQHLEVSSLVRKELILQCSTSFLGVQYLKNTSACCIEERDQDNCTEVLRHALLELDNELEKYTTVEEKLQTIQEKMSESMEHCVLVLQALQRSKNTFHRGQLDYVQQHHDAYPILHKLVTYGTCNAGINLQTTSNNIVACSTEDEMWITFALSYYKNQVAKSDEVSWSKEKTFQVCSFLRDVMELKCIGFSFIFVHLAQGGVEAVQQLDGPLFETALERHGEKNKVYLRRIVSLIECIVDMEFPLVSNAFKMANVSISSLVSRWLKASFWYTLSWENVAEFVGVGSNEHMIYFVLTLFVHLQENCWSTLTKAWTLNDAIQWTFPNFVWSHYQSHIKTWERRYQLWIQQKIK